MRTLVKTILLAGVAAGLAACSTACPMGQEDYGKPPYVTEGTAGTGVAVYGTDCKKPAKKAPMTKSAEPVFKEKMRK